MKELAFKFSRILVLSISLTFILITLAPAYDLNEYFPLDNGNTWIYLAKKDGEIVTQEGRDQEVRKVKGAEKVGETETKMIASVFFDSQCVTIDSEGVKLHKSWGWYGGEYEIPKPAQMLYPNIELGESKEYSVRREVYNIQDVISEKSLKIGTLTITLDAIEDVEVPAGKFTNCLKFTSVEDVKWVNTPEIGKVEIVSWLASGVGLIKQSMTIAEHNQDTNVEEKSVETIELTSATIAGNKLQVQP